MLVYFNLYYYYSLTFTLFQILVVSVDDSDVREPV